MVYIKLKLRTDKRYGFLTPSGGVNHLKVHAARFDSVEKAQAIINENVTDNPEWDWRVVET